MRYTFTRSIRDLLHDFIEDNNIERQLMETAAVEYWNELVEKGIGHYSGRVWISKGVLYAEITSPVVRNELMIIREEIRKKINEKTGAEVVRQIVLR
jgi:hypothetical protein